LELKVKRVNPDTGKPFIKGDVREDGMRFWSYDKTQTYKKTGFYWEHWRNSESYVKQRKNSNVSRLKHAKQKPWMACANANKRYAAKLNRTPKWLTKEHHLQINNFYLLAKEMEKKFGKKFEVDHIVPMQGEQVSGLHVPWNLQILTKAENVKKSNKHG
jgi:hypothetical protein